MDELVIEEDINKEENKEEDINKEDMTVEMSPEILSDHDDEQYYIEIGLPGVKKEDIDLVVGGNHLCIKAPKKDITYTACLSLAHIIDTSKVTTKFDNGELTITAPFVHPLKGVKVPIE